MVPGLDSVANEYCQKASKLHNSYLKMPQKHSYQVFIGVEWKGWILEHFEKFHFWRILAILWDFMFDSSIVSLVLLDSKFAVIMLCYDFIVINVTPNLEGLLRLFLKRDEPKIISNDRK